MSQVASQLSSRPILVTGAAGFIGSALCERLLQRGDRVIGIDNLNDYYDPALKQARLARIEALAAPTAGAWSFQRLALEDGEALLRLFAAEQPRVVVNLAAQAGVRYSLENPAAYIQATWWVLATSLKGVVTMALRIWCMPPAARCMAATAICRSKNSKR